jgi:hypothetical protein
VEFITVKEATDFVGGLSNTSKMPCKSYGLSAYKCKTGSKLRKIPGSACDTCFALKNRYMMGPVPIAHYRRIQTIYKPEWVPAMVRAINNAPHFRWHDSGDIQSVRHLTKIVRVAELTPDTKHWLPTHEYKMVSTYLKKHGSFPENLIVRISAAMVDGQPPKRFALTSTIHKNQEPIGYECPAHTQDNECKDCRACWDPEVKNISYEWH